MGVFGGCRRKSEHMATGRQGRPGSFLRGSCWETQDQTQAGKMLTKGDQNPILIYLIEDVTRHQTPESSLSLPQMSSTRPLSGLS